MKRVLIIGANSYLAKSFMEIFDKEFEFVALRRDDDLKDYFELNERRFFEVDTVVNFAAIVHTPKASKELHKRYNYELVKHLASLAKGAGVGHFVQISTIAVYGNATFIGAEIKSVPNTPYGEYKLKADEYLNSLEDDDFAISVLRPAIVYGKDAPGNMQSLFNLIGFGLPLPLGYYQNQRTILSIENFLEALKIVLLEQKRGVFLLKDSERPSIGDLTVKIREILGVKTLVLPMPKLLVKLLLKSKISAFEKLFGNLVVDDSVTVKELGEYQRLSWRKSIEKMV